MIRLLLVVLALLMPVPAQAGTIVFDFEDGLQGWELFGSAQRVQTQLLGGEWAIFGDGVVTGFAVTRMVFREGADGISLDRVIDVTFDVLVIQGPAEPRLLGISCIRPGPCPEAKWEISWHVLINPNSNPNIGDIITDLFPVGVVAFIDNITFHTIPEPSVLRMLVLGAVAALARYRGRSGRRV